MKRIAIVQFPGSNCETESAEAVFRNGMEPVPFLWNQPIIDLESCHGYFIVGGFSYEDRSRAGVIASLDPVMEQLRLAATAGRPILGACNGAQILVESGLVPGMADFRIGMALAPNRRVQQGKVLGHGFYNSHRHLQLGVPPERSAFTLAMDPGSRIRVPIAHGEGRFLAPTDLLDEIQAEKLVAFRYVTENGSVDPEFPANPNGSIDNAAAILNPSGNVMAMMPHPERVEEGDGIFQSMREYLELGRFARPRFLRYQRPPFQIEAPCPPGRQILQFPIGLIITDNAALSVQNALGQKGFSVRLERRVLWEIEVAAKAEIDAIRQAILDSGELFNSNKEFVEKSPPGSDLAFVVQPNDDPLGEAMHQTLTHRFGIEGLTRVRRSILWRVMESETTLDSAETDALLRTHIFHNPVSEKVVRYG